MPAGSPTRDPAPTLYFDLASPYAYLALERAGAVLGAEPELRPVLVGAIFRHRGWGSWADTEDRDRNVAELERRAKSYGLPLAWPPGWPPNSLAAQRACIYAQQLGLLAPFARAASRAAFRDRRDLRQLDVIVDVGKSVGLEPAALGAALQDPAIKESLKRSTDEAIAVGVMGVPSIR